MNALHLFYVPVPSREEGLRIARQVTGDGLAACGNLLGSMTSVFEWKGEVCEEEEQVLILKTTPEKGEALRARVLELHPYECPCILSWEAAANPAFADWVGTQTS
jgi:periplasmic divalent cation tolerance protein